MNKIRINAATRLKASLKDEALQKDKAFFKKENGDKFDVLGEQSGFCYGTFDSEDAAAEMVEKLYNEQGRGIDD